MTDEIDLSKFDDAKLTLELIPGSTWFSNVRSHVSVQDWNTLRRACYSEARNRCEICGGRGPKWPVECHEVFEYDYTNEVQRLVRLIALCPACHEVKHMGLAYKRGRFGEALKHLRVVNGWDEDKAIQYVAVSFQIWEEMSQIPWQVDLSHLLQKGIKIRARR